MWCSEDDARLRIGHRIRHFDYFFLIFISNIQVSAASWCRHRSVWLQDIHLEQAVSLELLEEFPKCPYIKYSFAPSSHSKSSIHTDHVITSDKAVFRLNYKQLPPNCMWLITSCIYIVSMYKYTHCKLGAVGCCDSVQEAYGGLVPCSRAPRQ